MDDSRHIPTRVVGLRYDPEAGLPQVILKGVGPLADELLQRRTQPGSPAVVRNPALLQALYRLPIDARIGPQLFHTVAAILAHVLGVDATLAHNPEPREERHG